MFKSWWKQSANPKYLDRWKTEEEADPAGIELSSESSIGCKARWETDHVNYVN